MEKLSVLMVCHRRQTSALNGDCPSIVLHIVVAVFMCYQVEVFP